MNSVKKTLIVLLALSLFSPTAMGKRGKRSKKRAKAAPSGQVSNLRLELIDTTLLHVPFGKDAKGAVEWIRARIQRGFEPRLKAALDTRERDKLKHRMNKEFEAIEQQFVQFDGKRTGFEAGVVQGEFVAGADESLLLYRDGDTDHYLFFSGGVLWKYARPLKPSDSFTTLIRAWTVDQGVPSAKREVGGTVEGATWTGVDFTLSVDDRRLVSASDLLVIVFRKTQTDVEARRAKVGAAGAANSAGDDLQHFIE